MHCTRLLGLSSEKVKPTGNFGWPRCGQSDPNPTSAGRTNSTVPRRELPHGAPRERRSHAAFRWWKPAGRRMPPAIGLFEESQILGCPFVRVDESFDSDTTR